MDYNRRHDYHTNKPFMSFFNTSSKRSDTSRPSRSHDVRTYTIEVSPSHSASTSQHHSGHSSTVSPHPVLDTRAVSPPRTKAEEPRRDPRLYNDHRSVSPLGTSRFEQAGTPRASADTLRMRRPDTVQPHNGSNRKGPIITQQTTTQVSGQSPHLSRSQAVRSGHSIRSQYKSPETRLGFNRRQPVDSNFRNGGFSDWERF